MNNDVDREEREGEREIYIYIYAAGCTKGVHISEDELHVKPMSKLVA